jgi:hypothetical protein
MKKNVAGQVIGAQMISATTGDTFSGTVTCYVTGDTSSQTLGASASGVCIQKGNGLFDYIPTQAETNYNRIAFTLIGTGAIPVTVQVFTNYPQTGDAYAAVVGGLTISGTVTGVTNPVTLTSAYDPAKTAAQASTALSNATWTNTLASYLDSAISSRAPSLTALSSSTWTSTMAGYLDASISSIAASLSTVVPTTDAADAATVTTGSTISGSYTLTQTDDDNRFVLAPVNPGGLSLTLEFDIGLGRSPVSLAINGYWNGSSQYCNVYAYDALLGIWDQLTNSSTRMASRASDANYSFPLNREHIDPDTGVTLIKFVSTSTNTAHRLNLDRVLIGTVDSSTGSNPSITSQDVWTYSQRTLTSTTGEAVNSDEVADAVIAAMNVNPPDVNVASSDDIDFTTTQKSTLLSATYTVSVSGEVTLAASQPLYAPAKAGDQMDLVDAPNGDAITVIQSGLALQSTALSNATWTSTKASYLDAAITSRAAAATALSNVTWSDTKAGYLDAAVSGSIGSTISASDVWTYANRTLTSVGLGAGAIEWTYTLTSSITGLPIADVDVWITSDSNGANVLASGRTDAYGVVTFYLDAGTIYVWSQKSGWNFTNPDTETVT